MILRPLQFHWNFKVKNHQPHNLSEFVYSINHKPTLEDFEPHFSTIENMKDQLIPPQYHSPLLTITLAILLTCCVCCILSIIERTCKLCSKISNGLANFIHLISDYTTCLCQLCMMDNTGPPPPPPRTTSTGYPIEGQELLPILRRTNHINDSSISSSVHPRVPSGIPIMKQNQFPAQNFDPNISEPTDDSPRQSTPVKVGGANMPLIPPVSFTGPRLPTIVEGDSTVDDSSFMYTAKDLSTSPRSETSGSPSPTIYLSENARNSVPKGVLK